MKRSKSIFSRLRVLLTGPDLCEVSLLFLTMMVVMCVTSRAGESPELPAAVRQSLTQAVDKVMEKYPVPGAVAGVVRVSDGATWRMATGFAAVDDITAPPAKWRGEPMTTDRVLRIGSVTKTFTATLILKLVEGDKLDLGDTVEQWLPGWVENGEKITVRALLNMTSGLAEYATPKFNEFVVKHPKHRWSPRQLAHIADNDDDRFEAPGRSTDRSRFRYRNTNYILLGAIAERAGGDSYGALIREHVTAPLELQHTTIPQGARLPDAGSCGYVLDEDGWADTTRIDPSFIWSAGGMISTLDDMLKWTRITTSGRDLTARRWRQRLDVRPTPRKDCQIWYGAGIEFKDGAAGHNGTIIGYESSCYRYAGYVYVAMVNCTLTTKKMPQVADAMTDAMIEAVAGSAPEPCSQDLHADVRVKGEYIGKPMAVLTQSESHGWDRMVAGSGWGKVPHFSAQSAVHSLSAVLHRGKMVEFRFRCKNLTGKVGKITACGLRPHGARPVLSDELRKTDTLAPSIWLTPAGKPDTLEEDYELEPDKAYDVHMNVRDNGHWDIEPARRLITIVVALGRKKHP